MALTHMRLFGRTVIDAFDFNYGSWYMTQSGTTTKITATAAQLNGLAALPLAAATFAPSADYFYFKDATDSAGKYQLWTDVATLLVGTEATTGLTHSSGVLAATQNYTAAAVDVANDDFVFKDHSDSEKPKVEAIADLVSAMAGNGLGASAGTLNTSYVGTRSVGTVRFTAKGDATSVLVGAIEYTRTAVPVVTNGEWTEGASANDSATNLAAAINGDTRNSGASYYKATANTDTVHIYSIDINGNTTVTRNGGAEPSSTANLVGGLPAVVGARSLILEHTVTANDVDGAVLINIPLPFAPRFYMFQVLNSGRAFRYAISDTFTIGTNPNRIIVTNSGASHIVATDIVVIYAQE